MSLLTRGKYRVRFAAGDEDIRAAQELRYKTFIDGRETASNDERTSGIDSDEFDPICEHVLVEESASDKLICCFRMLRLENGSEIARSYSAKYYDLSASLGGP